MPVRPLALALALCVASPQELDPVPQLIARLGAESVQARDQAESELLRLGEAAAEALRKAASSGDREVATRAGRILRTLEIDRELRKLAESLAAELLKPKEAAPLRDAVRALLLEFAGRHRPAEGVAHHRTLDGRTLTIAIGSSARKGQDAPAVEAQGSTRWVIAVGGDGEVVNLDRLPTSDESVPMGMAALAFAKSESGLAIALAGDGAVLRLKAGTAGGGAGGDATAESPVLGLALGGRDRWGCVDPPMNGDEAGVGTLDAAKAWLRDSK